MMQSNKKVSKFTRMGQYVHVAFNETEGVTEEGDVTYHYESAKIPLLGSREKVIQALVRIKYKDIDSELAANLNGGTEQAEHAAWRTKCKQVATEFEVFVKGILSE